jgi:hypothetical protein
MKPLWSKSLDVQRDFLGEIYDSKLFLDNADAPLLTTALSQPLSLARRVHDHPGLIINPKTHMAWRPYENLIDGELDNRTPGKVRNSDLERVGTYMDGFASMQRGETGDITAGLSLGPWTEHLSQQLLAQHELSWEQAEVPASERDKRRQELADSFRERIESNELFYPYVDYPYIEWYSEANGRVVLELAPKQVEILDGGAPPTGKTTRQLVADQRRRQTALMSFLGNMAAELSGVSRRRDAASSTSEKANE